MRIAITGSSGLIGSALSGHLREQGHVVVPVVRDTPGPGQIGWSLRERRLDPADLSDIDAVVHLAGAPIADHRWTDEYRREILESRTLGTTLVAEAIAASGRPTVLISASGIDYYDSDDDEPRDETSPPGEGFLSEVCIAWEAAADPARAAGIRVAHTRTGIVQTPRGGALKKQLPLFKLGLGGKFGDGSQWWSWISLPDEVRAITHLLTSSLAGPVNLTAPHPVTNAQFTTALARVLGRPAFLRVPKFGPKLLLGELGEELLFHGPRVVPRALLDDGFEFRHPEIEAALRAVLER